MNKKADKPSGDQQQTDLETLIQVMKQENLDEIEIVDGELHIKLSREQRGHFSPRGPGASFPSQKEKGPVPEALEPEGHMVEAPIAGVFYRSPSPASPPFVKEGDSVTTGQALCIIEAMKVMNEISAPRSGIVKKIKVENGKPVDANQSLFVLSPT